MFNLSIVVPAYNEEGNIAALYERLRTVLTEIGLEWEIIFIDDGSTDQTRQEVTKLHDRDARVSLISLSRNFGHQIALTAGLDYANGDAVIVMDADLQHPPEVLKDMVERWKEGYEIVYTLRTATDGVGPLKSWTSSFYYRLFRWLTELNMTPHTADFRLMDRKVVLALRQMRERVRFLRGLTHWVGYRSIAIPYRAASRQSGESKYTFFRMLRFALDGIVSFSVIPLHIAAYMGFFMAGLGFIYAIYALYARFVSQTALSGWTSLIMVSLLIGGIQLMVLGLLGIYIGKLFEEVKQRPLYLIRGQLGNK